MCIDSGYPSSSMSYAIIYYHLLNYISLFLVLLWFWTIHLSKNYDCYYLPFSRISSLKVLLLRDNKESKPFLNCFEDF